MNSFSGEHLKRINYLTGEFNAVYHEAALKLRLSDSALQILYAICNYGDACPLADICRLSGTSKQTLNSALRKLEAEGFLYLESLSGKKKKVCLTDTGRQLTKETALPLMEIENEILASWTKEELETYVELTKRYLSAFRKRVKELPERRIPQTAQEDKISQYTNIKIYR